MIRSPAMIFADLDLALMRLTGLRGIIDAPSASHLSTKALAAAMNKAVDHVVCSYAELVVADGEAMDRIETFLSARAEGPVQ